MKHVIRIYKVLLLIAVSMAASASASAAVYLRITIHDEDEFEIEGALVTVVAGDYTLREMLVDETFYYEFPDDMITGVAETNPHQTRLLQNFPNPFNPATTIEFSLEAPAHATLTIYSITGQKVRTMVDGWYGAGLHRLTWNGRDDAGRGVSAGVYLCRLVAGDFIETRKMLLMDGGGNFSPSAPLMTGAVPAAKPAGDSVLVIDRITAEKIGYKSVTMEDVRLPIEDNDARFDIELESETAIGDFFSTTVGDSLLYGTLKGSTLTIADTLKVLDEVTIDGKTYLRYSDWPPFVPDVLCVDELPPLIRLTAEGEIYVRFYDIDILVFDINDNQELYKFLDSLEYYSEYFESHPEQAEEYREASVYIIIEEKGEALNTPIGILSNCIKFHMISVRSYEESVSYDLYYDPSAGFVYKDGDEQRMILVAGTVGGERVGAAPVPPDGSVTGRDIAEMIRMTMEWHMPYRSMVDVVNHAFHPPELFIARDGLEEATPYLPAEISGIPITVMTLAELKQRANELGDFPIFYLRTGVTVEDEIVSFCLDYHMITADDSPGGWLWGESYGMEFNRNSEYWIGELVMHGIS